MHRLFVRIFEFTNSGGGSLGDRDVSLTVAAKEVTESNALVGAALIAQAMYGGCLLEAFPMTISLVGC